MTIIRGNHASKKQATSPAFYSSIQAWVGSDNSQAIPQIPAGLIATGAALEKTATTASCLAALEGLRASAGAMATGWDEIRSSTAFTKLAGARLTLESRIKAAEKSDHVPTVAVDLDGTIAVHYEKYDPAFIPDPRPGAKKALQEFQRRGWRIIIFTVRGNKQLVKDWLNKHDVPYDYINENPDQPEGSSDKVMADLYIDDRGVDAQQSWQKITETVIARIEKKAELAQWQSVPGLVVARLKEASVVQKTIRKVIKHLPVADPGYGYVYWNPETKAVWAVLSDSDEQQTHQKWHNALKAIQGVRSVRTESEYGPHGDPEWVRIKDAAATSWLGAPYRLAGHLTGGASPLSNTIVNTLLGAGAGYGLGFMAEQVLPEEQVERGTLRRNLALLGGGAGLIPGAMQAYTNNRISQVAGKPMGMSAIWKPDAKVPISPHEHTWKDSLRDGTMEKTFGDLMRDLPAMDPMLKVATENFVKEAYGYQSGVMGSQGVPYEAVPVDAFNNAVWNDVHKGLQSSQNNPFGTRSMYGANQDNFHTPPAVGAAVTGLVSGIQQQYGGAQLLSPRHFTSGLVGAGVDLATARVAGGVLGALGGLTPTAQNQLQNMGIWGGFMRGVAKSVLGI